MPASRARATPRRSQTLVPKRTARCGRAGVAPSAGLVALSHHKACARIAAPTLVILYAGPRPWPGRALWQLQRLGLLLVHLKAARLIVAQRIRAIERARVHPHPMCAPSPGALDARAQQVATEPLANKARQQPEIGHL